MKRTLISAALGAALLMLTACGGESGTPSASSSPATTATSTPTSAPTETTPSATTHTSAEPPPTSQETTPESSSSAQTSGDRETVTLSGDVDSVTRQWVATLCTGIQPLADLQDLTELVDPQDVEGSLDSVGEALIEAGLLFHKAAGDLNALPPPTFQGGDQLATAVVGSFEAVGERLVDLGESYVDLDPTDPQAVAKLGDVGQDLAEAMRPLQEQVFDVDVDPELDAQLEAVPECAMLSGS